MEYCSLRTVLILIFVNLAVGKAPDSLRFVHAIWRHGDRSPSSTFKTDTKNGEKTWPQGWGELSQRGMQQQYELGKYIKKRYDGFLQAKYSKYEIYVRSTSYNRTIMSALANMAGMYPPEGNQVWNKNITWQPIPVHNRPREMDPMLWMEAECPVETQLYDILMNSKEVTEIMDEHSDFLKLLRKETELDSGLGKLDDIWQVYDPLTCEMFHNDTHTWPKWVNASVYANVKKLYDLSTKYYYYTPAIQRFRGGMLLGDIIERMKGRKTGTLDSRLKYYVYSAHDTTTNALLSNLGAYNGINPPYAAAILIELHERNKNWEVEVWYRNDSKREPYQLLVSDCPKKSCSFEDFVKRSQDHIPDDWHAECGLVDTSSLIVFKVATVVLGCISMILIMAFCWLFLLWWRLKKGAVLYSPVRSEANDIT